MKLTEKQIEQIVEAVMSHSIEGSISIELLHTALSTITPPQPKQIDLNEVRTAFADYCYSEGCSCCESTDDHKEAMAKLGELLKIDKYDDGSGYDYSKYRTLNDLKP